MTDHPSNAKPEQAVAERNRRQFYLLIAVFFGPMFVAMFLYFGADYRPPDRTNYGQLNEPAKPLPSTLGLQAQDGSAIDRAALADDWTMVQWLPADCGDDCQQALYLTRQVWLSLDRRRVRVQRMAVMPPGSASSLQPKADTADPNLQIVEASSQQLATFFSLEQPEPMRVYVIDPIGNWVMTYPPGWEPAGMLKDIKKLLKISRIG